MKTERTPAGGSNQPGSPQPLSQQPCDAGASHTVDDEIHRLVAAGKCKQAVELAKNQHKRVNTPESRRSLVQAYVARIEQFQAKRMTEEARTLLTLVQERFPAERHQLAALEIRAAAAAGRIDDLLRPLASEKSPPEIRDLIETAVRRHIVNLPAVAACNVLPAGHPLRSASAAIWRAFEAVTKGPVTDADISLPEVSHRSPLAAWKLAIRAIAAFYRRDDEGCRRAIDAIPADAAVARIGTTLRGMLGGAKPSTGIAAVLHNRVLSDDQNLRAALQKIESSSSGYNLTKLVNGIRDALRSCSAGRPELLERLRQHISVWCMDHDVPIGEVRKVLGTTPKNAHFWKLMARMNQSKGPPALSAIFWERFLRHAVHEGMFTESSAEAATIWLHIANLLGEFSLRELNDDRGRMGESRMIISYYEDQPAEIAALRPDSAQKLADHVLEPGRAFSQAAAIRPDAQTFELWWNWAHRVKLPIKQAEDIALQWHRSRSRDVQPLILLAILAESRNALSMAIKWIGEAEAIDPLSQHVRQARTRLTLSIAWRHFADRKAHLVEKDLAELEALPNMAEGDRAAVLESMRGAWHLLRGDTAAEAASLESVIQRLGPLAGRVIFNSIKKKAKLGNSDSVMDWPNISEASPVDIARAKARTNRVAMDLNFICLRPENWSPLIVQALRQRPCALSTAELFAIAESSISVSDLETAYLASAAGLTRTDLPGVTARFLLLRAQSLSEPWQQPRTRQCLLAALELARQAHDEDLIREVFASIDRNRFTSRMLGRDDRHGMARETLQKVLENERKADEPPRDRSEVDSFVVEGINPKMAAPFFQINDDDAMYEDDEGDEEDYDFADEDDEDEGFPNLFGFDPPSLMDEDGPEDDLPSAKVRELDRVLKQNGVSSSDQLMDDPTPLIAAMAKIMGRKISPAEIRAMAEELKGMAGAPATKPSGGFGGFFGRRSKKSKKRRR